MYGIKREDDESGCNVKAGMAPVNASKKDPNQTLTRTGDPGASDAMDAGLDEPIRVAIVDDHPIMREGLVHTFEVEEGFEVVARGATADDAIRIAETLMPDLILLDINMPGNGIAAACVISKTCPAVRIVILSAYDMEEYVIDALRCGASGYLVKGVSSSELIQTAHAVLRGEAYVSPGLAAKLLSGREVDAPPAKSHGIPQGMSDSKQANDKSSNDGIVSLTGREEQILRQVSKGLSNKEIGENVGLSEKTIKHYMTNILNKLHARNRVEAALIARRHLGGAER